MVLIYTRVRNRNVIEINIREQRIEFNSSAERKIQAPDICISDDIIMVNIYTGMSNLAKLV